MQDSFKFALYVLRIIMKLALVNRKIVNWRYKMRKITAILMAGILSLALTVSAGTLPATQVSQILEHQSSLELTNSQINKLTIIENTAREKMTYARMQADIRLQEIEKFTSNWTNMNGTAVRGLIKEYYDILSQYKTAELNAIVQARAIHEYEQLSKFQQLESIESLMINMERELALR